MTTVVKESILNSDMNNKCAAGLLESIIFYLIYFGVLIGTIIIYK